VDLLLGGVLSSASEHAWPVRARRISSVETRVYARNHAFSVGEQAALRDRDDHPSAIEVLLGALAADLLRGFETQAGRRQIAVHAGEADLRGQLANVLVHLGVIGEVGSAALASVAGTVHVSTDADDGVLAEIWRETLERSPLHQTLSRCAILDIRVRAAP
jgi:hypothetical protein